MCLFQWTRLPFGIASSPAIFQSIMDKVLNGLSGTVWYIDDILVTGKDNDEHLKNLEELFIRLEKFGFRARSDKCSFMQNSIQYLGHFIDRLGVRPIQKKVDAIADMPEPQNVGMLESFIGLINYYGKFIPNLATLAHL